ncbi:MAG: SH3 domain-containing protein [Lyngbya sp.]|nr:SH3 domain-containing protein [Lyngbya sp.]
MNRLSSGSGWVSGLSAVLMVAIAMPIPAIADEKPPASKFSRSQGRVVQSSSDLCRQVFEPQGLAIRQRPTPNSPRVGGVRYRDQVTLVGNYEGIRGPGGRTWLEITSPVRGFISNGYPGGRSNLVLCSDNVSSQPPQQTASLCRRIDRRAAPGGVAVRQRPSRLSSRVGGVPTGREVYLVEDYQLIRDPNNEPRNWVEIAEPLAGFISANTLIMCR